jgi:hypothetical protein
LVRRLGTKDPQAARAKAPGVIAEFEAVLAAAHRAGVETPPPPSHREIAALAGEWYRQRVGAYGDQTIQDLHWEIAIAPFGGPSAVTDPRVSVETEGASDEVNQQRAEGLSRLHSFSADPERMN